MTIASIAIGYRFIEVKEMEGYGGWLPWLAARASTTKPPIGRWGWPPIISI